MNSESAVLFIALIDMPDEHADQYREWRNNEMVPTQLAVPGFRSIRCFEAVEDPENPYVGANRTPRFMHVYEIDRLDSLREAASDAQSQSPLAKLVHENFSSVALNVYREVVVDASTKS